MQSGRKFYHSLPDVTCKKTETFVLTAVKTSDLTISILIENFRLKVVKAHIDIF
jgi:hypothetical protein